jgi:hypothetical protein
MNEQNVIHSRPPGLFPTPSARVARWAWTPTRQVYRLGGVESWERSRTAPREALVVSAA